MAASAALAPLFGGAGAAAGGAAAGAAVGGGLLSSGLFGSVLTGVASGWMKSIAEDREDKRIQQEEERRAKRYSGLGEAVRFWDNSAEEDQTQARKIAAQPALGQRPDAVGNQFKERAERNRTKMPKVRYNRERGEIEYG